MFLRGSHGWRVDEEEILGLRAPFRFSRLRNSLGKTTRLQGTETNKGKETATVEWGFREKDGRDL